MGFVQSLLAVFAVIIVVRMLASRKRAPTGQFGRPSADYGSVMPDDRTEAQAHFQQLWGSVDHQQYLSDAMLEWRGCLRPGVCIALNTLYTDACGCGGAHWRGAAAPYAHGRMPELPNTSRRGVDAVAGINANRIYFEEQTKDWRKRHGRY